MPPSLVALPGVVVEQVQRADFRVMGQIDHLADGRVPPAGFALVLRVGVRRVRDQCVGALDESDQPFEPGGVVFSGAFRYQFVVRHVADRGLPVVDAIAEAFAGARATRASSAVATTGSCGTWTA